MNRYNSVNATAEQAAANPFKLYSTDPNAFVAPLTSTQQAGIANTNAASGLAQPYYQQATGQLLGAQGQAQPYYGAATGATNQAVNTGNLYGGASTAAIAAAGAGASPYSQQAGQAYQGAYDLGLGGANAAQGYYSGAQGAAQPLQDQAAQGITDAYSGAQPYQQGATAAALAGMQGVNPGDLDAAAINKYLSPYLGTVVGNTAALLNQQNQQAQAGQLGNAIRSGAFGGDRAGIASAVLQGQQNLASGNVLSNLLQQGYGQALSTAQQQQQLGLGAAQANRAALQQGSTQLQGIGQQGYEQGLGAAQARAALGQQQFGQQMGLGAAEQGLGAQLNQQGNALGAAQQGLGQQVFGQGMTTAQQLAALGQQQYGQELGAGQQYANLGQGLYNIGSSTAQNLAGLGAGAQSAALQGAQAQLAAGQAQQQTEQAGKQALYNQFLQQQSYPFQVAQFLANIAEGTGSLSGSTTTTTQPGGFFSDKRLKENIDEVGKTYDGQPIYSYNYKGDDGRKQLGLMAQDVEKHHPDAVGVAGGYKTVDYGKATEDAAKRGHFADGGLAGYDPSLMASILSNQAGMFGPYLSGLAGGVGSGQGTMYGGSGRVPAANLPVGHLMTAGPLPEQRTGLQNIKEAVDLGKGVSDLYGKGKALVSDLGHKDDNADIGDVLESLDEQTGHARGGLAGYASGGMPYDNQINGPQLDIPDDPQKFELKTPGQLPGQGKSGFSQVVDAAKTAASLVALLQRGGRVGKASGGELDALMSEVNPDMTRSLLHQLLLEREQPSADEPTDDDASAPAQPDALASVAPIAKALQAIQEAHNGSLISSGDKSGTRADRNNNPGNIQDGKFAQNLPGYMGSDGRFAVFKTPEAGKNAQLSLLASYLKRGYDTPIKLASRWAPAGDGSNDPSAYANFIAKRLGVGAGDRLDASHLGGLGEVQARMEGWRKTYADGGLAELPDDFLDGVTDAAPQAPSNAPQAPIAAPTGLAPIAPVAPAPIAAANDDSDEAVPAEIRRGPSPTDRQGLVPYDTPFIKGIGRGQASSIIPILSGLAAMGTAPTRHLGVALAAGLGAGTQSYQQQRNFDLERIAAERAAQQLGVNQGQLGVAQQLAGYRGVETGLEQQMTPARIAQMQAEAALARTQAYQQAALTDPLVKKAIAEGKLTDANVQAVRAGLLTLNVVPGLGGGTGAIVVTDRGKLANGAPGAVSTINIGDAGAPGSEVPGNPPAGAPGVSPPAIGPNIKNGMWTHSTAVPTGYTPPGQMTMFLEPGTRERATADGQKILTEASDESNAASQQLMQLYQMGQQFRGLPRNGLLTPGTGANARINFAKAVNTAATALGGNPVFNADNIAAAETISKDSKRLGFALARSLGAREPASIIEQAISINPGIENTPMGYLRLSTSAKQAALYRQDRANFFNDYFSKFHHLNGAENLFEKLNPSSYYAKRAIMETVTPKDRQLLLQHAKESGVRADFDAKYGRGVSGYFVR